MWNLAVDGEVIAGRVPVGVHADAVGAGLCTKGMGEVQGCRTLRHTRP